MSPVHEGRQSTRSRRSRRVNIGQKQTFVAGSPCKVSLRTSASIPQTSSNRDIGVVFYLCFSWALAPLRSPVTIYISVARVFGVTTSVQR